MKKIIILLILAGAGYQAWDKFSPEFTREGPLYDKPYVVVYGRNSCGFTQRTMKELKKSGIPFEYKIVDDKSVAEELHSRMNNAGIDTRLYNLPVIDANNNFSIRPTTASILKDYNKPLHK